MESKYKECNNSQQRVQEIIIQKDVKIHVRGSSYSSGGNVDRLIQTSDHRNQFCFPVLSNHSLHELRDGNDKGTCLVATKYVSKKDKEIETRTSVR